MNVKKIILIVLVLFGFTNVFAQADWYYENWSDSRIDLEIDKTLNNTRILYVAAHPDDENTRLISWLVNKVNADVAYLSLTNGSGGQNLIGEEIGEELGLIREQELYAARRTDGGEQYFTSALDFGYSKSYEETFEQWDKQKILEQVVKRIRTFKPHIIITRFSPVTEGLRNTHGHHTASAILAVEAFQAAADPNRFRHQLDELSVWETDAIYWNTSYWSYGSQEKLDSVVNAASEVYVKLNVDDMVFQRGLTSSQIAAASRSMHKSQGFGTMTYFGTNYEYLQLLRGKTNARERLHPAFSMLSSFSYSELEKAKQLEYTDKADHILKGIDQGVNAKKLTDDQVKRLQHIYLKSKALTFFVTLDDNILPIGEHKIKISALQYDPRGLNLEQIKIDGKGYAIKKVLQEGELFEHEITHNFSEAYTQPKAILQFDGIEVEVPIIYRTSDPVKGEIIQPAFIAQDALLTIDRSEILIFNGQDAYINLKVQALNDISELEVNSTQTVNQKFGPMKKGEIKEVKLKVWDKNKRIGDVAAREYDEIMVTANGQTIKHTTKLIKYDHIPWIYNAKPAHFNLKHINAKIEAKNIGYVMGAGDMVPEAIRALGAEVTLIDAASISAEELKAFDAVVFGIRALNVLEDIDPHMDKFYAYAENGGTLIMQYNTSHRLKTEKIGGVNGGITLSRDRVTEEDAAVNVLSVNDDLKRVFNSPNQISDADWNNWVQERGLYFPSAWDESRFTALLSMHDTGEQELKGSLIVGKMGEGYFVYTGISFFRELPAGVDGAFKLWANLLSL